MARYGKQWRERERQKIGDLPNALVLWLATTYDQPANDLDEFLERVKRFNREVVEAHHP